ncbi:beta strand repeat-containing protein [Paludisphaera rhizosphaerae]|uniref:beta strand repeat-containing protein n=1 Tax=Paludisphaera rhizosphaerae TaxID=2711216 RepID=UPI0013ECA058|nr:Ig-like domain-containing protein [Paludisphaera rhizosphaerae]
MHRDRLSSLRDRFLPSRRRPRRSSRRLFGVEALEGRRLLAASLDVTTGSLAFQATGSAMNLSISVDSSNVYTFRDPTQTITLGSGATSASWTISPDGHTATGPGASISSIAVVGDPGTFNDVVSVSSTGVPTSITTGLGADTFYFTAPTITAAVTLSNAAGGATDSDAVNYALGGVDATFATGALGRETLQSAATGAGLISVTSVKPLYTSSFPDIALQPAQLDLNLNSLYVTPTALSTTLSIASNVIQASVQGGPVHTFTPGTIDGFTVGGTTAGSTLTVDYTNGVPYGPSLDFAPPVATSGASNTLVLKGGTFTQQAYVASSPGAGSIVFPNRTVGSSTITNVIDFSNLSPIIDTVTATGFTFSAPSGAQSIEMLAGSVVSGVQTTRIRSTTSAFEQVDFANKTNVSVTTGTGADTISADLSTPARGLSTVSIATGDGDDTIVLLGAAATVKTTIDAGAGAGNLIDLSNANSLAGLKGDVYALATGGSTELLLDDSANTAADSFTIYRGRITGGPLGTFVDYGGSGVTSVDLRGGSGNDTFTFVNFGGPTSAQTYNVAGGSGTDSLIVNSSVAPTDITTAGVLNFGSGQPSIDYTSIEQITINVGMGTPVGTAVTINAVEAQAFVQRTVARFSDASPTTGAVYYASIDWGDGSPISGGQIVAAGVTGVYEVLGNHSYAAAATSYPVTVTVTRQGGGSGGSTTTVVDGVPITVNNGVSQNVVISSKAVVAAAPLSAQAIPFSGRANAPLVNNNGGIQVGSFTDSGTNLDPSAYTVAISWGDGTTTGPTQITTTGTAGGRVYNIFGNHYYTQPGTYPITILVTKPPVAVTAPAVAQAPPGAQAVAATTVTILPAALTTITGRLNPASDSGVSNSDGITNVVQPTYSGLVDSPGATVAVVATSPVTGAQTLLGATQADEAGAWSVTSGAALTDGYYFITVYAADRYNSSNVVSTILSQSLLIDTYAPRILAAAFVPKSGYVQLVFQDYGGAGGGSGMALSTIQDPSNFTYSFVSSVVKGYRPPSQWLVGPITVTPATTSGPQTANIVINGGKAIRGGVYQIIARSKSSTLASGLQDLAGNALDGEFYGTYPSGNGVSGGDFTARLDSIHNRVYAPGTNIGPGTTTTPRRNVRR